MIKQILNKPLVLQVITDVFCRYNMNNTKEDLKQTEQRSLESAEAHFRVSVDFAVVLGSLITHWCDFSQPSALRERGL